jgi:predicted CoA-substrate-specific enzyme activase
MVTLDSSSSPAIPVQALGIDSGSTTVKIVGLDRDGKLRWHLLEPAEPLVEKQVDRLLEAARLQLGSLEGIPLVATGYGRRLVQQAARQVTEISCHARGAFQELGHGGTLIDIGGQDSKVISINPKGKVLDFMMNDKCSAGTGRFLENTAFRLKVPLESLGEQALSTLDEASISSTCTVFAESEVISLIAHGVPLASILRGLHRSLIQRIIAMLSSVGIVPPLMLSGGVALNPAVQKMLQAETGEKVVVPAFPQLIGAQGAALIALESL